MGKVVKLDDERLLSLGVVQPADRRLLLESIANINSLSSESAVSDPSSYHIRDTKDPKLMRDMLALVSKLFAPKKTRQFRVVVERIEKIRNEPLSLAFKRQLKTLASPKVVQRAFFPPSIDTLSHHKDNNKVVTEEHLLGGGLATMESLGPVGRGIYFPCALNVHDSSTRLFRVIVFDVALGATTHFDPKVNPSAPLVHASDFDSASLAIPAASSQNAALKQDLAIKSAAQAVPRFVVSFRVHSATTNQNIRVVSADGSGDHRCILDALDAAESGDVVVLRPGIYVESLVIDSDVHIVAGARGSSVLDGTIKISSSCRLSGLAVKPSVASVTGIVVEVQQGSPSISQCDISGMVSVQSGAQLVLRECGIRNSVAHGILVGQKATCLVEQCEIEEIELCGMQVDGQARGIVMNSSISACKQNGIYLLDGARGKDPNLFFFSGTLTVFALFSLFFFLFFFEPRGD